MPAMLFPGHELRQAAFRLTSDNVRPGEDVLIVASSDQAAALVDALVAAADAAGPAGLCHTDVYELRMLSSRCPSSCWSTARGTAAGAGAA